MHELVLHRLRRPGCRGPVAGRGDLLDRAVLQRALHVAVADRVAQVVDPDPQRSVRGRRERAPGGSAAQVDGLGRQLAHRRRGDDRGVAGDHVGPDAPQGAERRRLGDFDTRSARVDVGELLDDAGSLSDARRREGLAQDNRWTAGRHLGDLQNRNRPVRVQLTRLGDQLAIPGPQLVGAGPTQHRRRAGHRRVGGTGIERRRHRGARDQQRIATELVGARAAGMARELGGDDGSRGNGGAGGMTGGGRRGRGRGGVGDDQPDRERCQTTDGGNRQDRAAGPGGAAVDRPGEGYAKDLGDRYLRAVDQGRELSLDLGPGCDRRPRSRGQDFTRGQPDGAGRGHGRNVQDVAGGSLAVADAAGETRYPAVFDPDVPGEADLLAADPLDIPHLLAEGRRESRPAAAVVSFHSAGQTSACDENLAVGRLDEGVRDDDGLLAIGDVAGAAAAGAIRAVHRGDETRGQLPLAVDELVLPNLIFRQRLGKGAEHRQFGRGGEACDGPLDFFEFLVVSARDCGRLPEGAKDVFPDPYQFRRGRHQLNRRLPVSRSPRRDIDRLVIIQILLPLSSCRKIKHISERIDEVSEQLAIVFCHFSGEEFELRRPSMRLRHVISNQDLIRDRSAVAGGRGRSTPCAAFERDLLHGIRANLAAPRNRDPPTAVMCPVGRAVGHGQVVAGPGAVLVADIPGECRRQPLTEGIHPRDHPVDHLRQRTALVGDPHRAVRGPEHRGGSQEQRQVRFDTVDPAP